MTIEQHAEAAADEIDRSMTDGPKTIIAKHMQDAIDEALAPLRKRNDTLVREIDRLEAEVVRANGERICTQEAYRKMDSEVVQTLGKALHYPWLKDDQKNFPGATEEDGVDVGDHVSESLAAEAAKRIAELERLGPLIGRLQALSMAYQAEDKASDEFCRVVDELRAAESQITAILKGGAP